MVATLVVVRALVFLKNPLTYPNCKFFVHTVTVSNYGVKVKFV